MKFKSDIEIQAGVEAGGSTGSNGQVLSSTGTNGVAWIDQNAITSSSDFVFFNVKNETGSTISKGKGVMAVGTDGNSGHILVDEMVANGTVESKYFLGVLEEDIANGAFARVISFGQLSQFNTSGQNGETWADGQVLWCDPANPGDFTITEPDGPNVKIAAAFIVNSSTNGKIQVRVQANEGIHDLHDTKITSQVDGDVLVWDNTTGVWFNNSTLNVDYTNSRVGIGTISPGDKLDVDGNAKISGRVDASQVRVNGNIRPLVLTKTTTLDAHITMKTTGEVAGFIASKNNHIGIGRNNGYSTDNLNIRKENGYVGIKQKAPLAPLHIKKGGEAIRLESAENGICSIDFRQGTNKRGHIQFENENDTLDIRTENPTGSTSKIKFSVAKQGQSPEEVMRIQSNTYGGKQVVIGNPNAVYSQRELYVDGSIETTGELYVGWRASIYGQCDADSYRVKGLNTPPATATSPGVNGEIRYTADYIYVCVQNNVWKRTALTSW
jgi:cytoskeletal protein CcmA (bactofilin family)